MPTLSLSLSSYRGSRVPPPNRRRANLSDRKPITYGKRGSSCLAPSEYLHFQVKQSPPPPSLKKRQKTLHKPYPSTYPVARPFFFAIEQKLHHGKKPRCTTVGAAKCRTHDTNKTPQNKKKEKKKHATPLHPPPPTYKI